MKNRLLPTWVGILSVSLLCVTVLPAQNLFVAYDVPQGVTGNNSHPRRSFGNDFHVVHPIMVHSLGVFDHLSDGIQSGVLTVQLYSRNNNNGVLLETLTFDPASPGELRGGHRFKPLPVPVTLIPGAYSIVAYGFTSLDNAVGNAMREPYTDGAAPWRANDGGGLIRFEGGGRHGDQGVNNFPRNWDRGPAYCFAAGSFTYSAAAAPAPAYSSDYAALVSSVTNFPLGNTRHIGSIAVFNETSFPVLVEPGGSRLVVQAGGFRNGDRDAGRMVAFAHEQFSRASGDPRAALFQNAMRWAARKEGPLVIGLGAPLKADAYLLRGHHLRMIPRSFESLEDDIPDCDLMILDLEMGYSEQVVARIADRAAQGIGVVMTMTPWSMLHNANLTPLDQANELMQPYGLAYRPNFARPSDLGFTNVSAHPYPAYFSAFPAAQLLGKDRMGQVRLTSLEKSVALNTINYAINARPDLMAQLTALSSGSAGNLQPPIPRIDAFQDIVVLKGDQATQDRLGQWLAASGDLIADDRRGSVDYDFTLPSPDMCRIQIEGEQANEFSSERDFRLLLFLDGEYLGQHLLQSGPGASGRIEAFTPYLPSGPHRLRVFWDNASSRTMLRIKSVRIQTGVGPDANGNGIKDWIEEYVRAQSGLDMTDEVLTSHVSPVCIEGRDPYPSLVRLHIEGSGSSRPVAHAAPNGRWYANVPLSPSLDTPTMMNVTYQNGVLSQWRRIHWVPLNLLSADDITIRKGDSLLLTARPEGNSGGQVEIMVGTNNPPAWLGVAHYTFNEAGEFTVSGSHRTESGEVVSGGITVKVVEQAFPENPAARVLRARQWELPAVAPEVLLEGDRRILFQESAGMEGGSRRVMLTTDHNEPRYVLARLGAAGPILSSARIDSFELWTGSRTYNHIRQTYEDGSQLIEILLVLSPVPPQITVQVDLIVGGVVFEDGTTTQRFGPADFDAQGGRTVRFIRPASAQTAVCHLIRLFQGESPIE